MIELLAQYPPLVFFAALMLGLLVGSFLNVVIHRLPIMMKGEWRTMCNELFGCPDDAQKEPLNLVAPRSRCPSCGHHISALDNIPVVSYVLLRGRCRACESRISPRYPAVEMLAGGMSLLVVWHFGLSAQSAAGLIFTWALIAISFIDIDEQIIPDNISLPLLWLGLAFNLAGGFTDLGSSVMGAMAGYLSLWTVYMLFKLVTGKEGMGFGDFKLLAALGAWLGWQQLPLIILLSSLLGALVGTAYLAMRGKDKATPIPFGPYLALAGWIAMLWGNRLTDGYLRWATPS